MPPGGRAAGILWFRRQAGAWESAESLGHWASRARLLHFHRKEPRPGHSTPPGPTPHPNPRFHRSASDPGPLLGCCQSPRQVIASHTKSLQANLITLSIPGGHCQSLQSAPSPGSASGDSASPQSPLVAGHGDSAFNGRPTGPSFVSPDVHVHGQSVIRFRLGKRVALALQRHVTLWAPYRGWIEGGHLPFLQRGHTVLVLRATASPTEGILGHHGLHQS